MYLASGGSRESQISRKPKAMKLARAVLLSVFLGYLTAAAGPASPKAASSSSDVFLITIDTLRADHIGCYGDRDIKTLTLDRLANDGILFTHAFTPSPITNTSHATILTGVLPRSHGVTDFGMPIAEGVPTLAEILKGQEYATAAFIGAVILDSTALAPGFDRGFDYYDNFPAKLPKTASRYERVERRGMVVVRHAEKWLLSHKTAQRRFVWLHLYDPHDPYDPPSPYDHQYAGRPYDGEIAYADSALGVFISFLKTLNLYDQSVIVVVGDHGEGLGEHGEQTHGIFLYDSTSHVPLILKLPRMLPTGTAPHSVVSGAQVRTLDIFPTILDLEGVRPPASLDGTSLRHLWSRPAAANAERVVLGETDYPVRFGWAPLKSVRTGGLKYIEAPRPEFYDLRADPQETHNSYEPWNEDVQRLRAMIAELRERPKTAALSQMRPQTLNQLRALGYLGSNPGSTTAPEPSLLSDPKDKIEVFNFIHRAMLAGEDRDINAARRDLTAALRTDPQATVALAELGKLELEQGNYNRAVESFVRFRQIRPGDPASALDEARARYAAGDLAGARDILEASAAVGQYDTLCLLGKIYGRLKDWDKAQDHLEAATFRDPRKPQAYIELARVFLERDNAGAALQQLEQVARFFPKRPEVFELMSQAYLKKGEKAKAERAAQRAKILKAKKP